MPGHLLVVAHVLAAITLLVGARAWLRAGAARLQPVATRRRSPAQEARYRELVAELAELERRREAGDIAGAAYDERRKVLLDAALGLDRE